MIRLVYASDFCKRLFSKINREKINNVCVLKLFLYADLS